MSRPILGLYGFPMKEDGKTFDIPPFVDRPTRDRARQEMEYKTWRGSMYGIQGSSCSPLIERAIFRYSVLSNPPVLELGYKDEYECFAVIYKIPMDRICGFTRITENGFQFINRHGDSAEEYAIQINEESEANIFKNRTEELLMKSSQNLKTLHCTIAEYNVDRKTFKCITVNAQAHLCQRSSDHEGYLIVKLEYDNYFDPLCNGLVYFEVISPAIQLWSIPACGQLLFWGERLHPDINQNSISNRSMFLLESVSEGNCPEVVEFFVILSTLLKERVMNQKLSPMELSQVKSVIGTKVGERHRYGEHEEWVRRVYTDSNKCEGSGAPIDLMTLVASPRNEDAKLVKNKRSHLKFGQDKGNKKSLEIRIDESQCAKTHKFMNVGLNHALVYRGDKIGGDDDELCLYKVSKEPSENFSVINGQHFQFEGQQIDPQNGLLHDKESKLLMTSLKNKTGVYSMDLERESIVRKWDTGNKEVDFLTSTFKHGSLSIDPTFLACNSKSMFLMDSRMKDYARTTTISYAKNPLFTAAATDDQGHILTGSKTGILRLYDGTPNDRHEFKRAKTQLSSIREPLLSVDITNDGTFILGTTKTYIVLYATRHSKTGNTGFDQSLGQFKPIPRYLRIPPREMEKYKIGEVNFTPAKFSDDETSVVSSTGRIAVIWDLLSVLNGSPKITVKETPMIIKDVQLAKDDTSLVVAYPSDVSFFGTKKGFF